MPFYAIASIEALFLVFLSMIGLMAGVTLKPRLDFLFLIATSYAVGLTICLVVVLVLIALPLPLSGSLLFFTLLTIFVCLLLFTLYTRPFSLGEVGLILFYLLAFSSLGWLLSYNNFMVASDDSLKLMRLGEILAHTGELDPKMIILGKWSIATAVFQAIANLSGVRAFTALLPLLLVPLLLGYARGCWLTMIQFDISKRYMFLSTIMGTVFLGTGVFIQWHAFYVNTHLASGLYLLFFVNTLLLASIHKEKSWLFFSSFFLIAFCLWRIEGIIFATIFLFLLLPAVEVDPKVKLFAALLVFLPVATWHLYLYDLYAPAKDFLNVKMLLMTSAMSTVVIFIGIASHFSLTKFIHSHGSKLMVMSVTLVVLFLSVAKPTHMAISLTATLGNVFLGYGLWKMEWLIVFPLLIMSQGIAKSFPLDRRLLAALVSFGLFLFAISYFRPPYRLSHWDSANRMLVHIFPCCLYYITLKFGVASSTSIESESN